MTTTAIILYWSVSGTTRRVAEAIAVGMRAGDAECTLHDLRAGLPSDVTSYDIVGVGFPIHWYRLPSPVSEALAALGPLRGRSAFAFSLNGTYRGVGLNRARAALARTGASEIGVFTSYGEDRFYAYVRLGWLFSPGHPTDGELRAAREFGTRVAAAHRARQGGASVPALPPPDPPQHPMYAFIRLASDPKLVRVLYSRLFRADPKRCTRCGTCARGCPAGNIAWSRGEAPAWGRECILCLECALTCPEAAVICPMDWAIFRPFVRWTTGRALRDPGIEHVRVELRRGTVTRV